MLFASKQTCGELKYLSTRKKRKQIAILRVTRVKAGQTNPNAG